MRDTSQDDASESLRLVHARRQSFPLICESMPEHGHLFFRSSGAGHVPIRIAVSRGRRNASANLLQSILQAIHPSISQEICNLIASCDYELYEKRGGGHDAEY